MNTKLLHRLAWKELRSLRALWLSLLGMAFVLQLVLAWLMKHPHERSEWVFSVALFLPVVYSLACAAMAFAGEREEGTDQFLSRLAAPPLALLGVKLGMNLLSTAILLIILYPLAWVLAPWQTYWDLSYWQGSKGPLSSARLLALAWGMGLLSWGLLCSLLFRRVLTCLIVATVATALTPVAVSVFLDLLPSQQSHSDKLEWTLRLGVIPGLLLLASVWLVQTWDEERWPRLIEWLVTFPQRLRGWRLRVRIQLTGADDAAISLVPGFLRTEVGSRAEIASVVRAILRRIGFCWPDEWLPAWRREVRRLVWLEWHSAWWVCMGLIVAGSLGLWAFVGTASSKTDMRLMLRTLPSTMAFVAFTLGVWSFHGQQREQRFRFFAGHGASPTTMWLVKHVVWFGLAVLAVAFLLSLTALFSDGAINRDEFSASGWQNVLQATFHDEQFFWSEMQRPDWRFRFIYCVAHTTFTRPTEFYDTNAVASVWPLVSLVWMAIGRGVLLVWLCFAVGQLVSLLIPRAVTSMLVGLVALGMVGWWWLVISILRVPLLIGVWPVLIGLLAASWGRMSDWLEERSGWRRWLRVAATALLPMLVAFAGMVAYRVYEVPLVELPWQPMGPASAEARRTGEDWLRLAERLESPFDRRDASAISFDGSQVRALERTSERRNPVDKNFIQIREANLDAIKDTHWPGFAERYWLTDNAAALEESLNLANRPDCVMPKSWEPSNKLQREQFGRLALLLKMSAFESLANHRLDEALQRALALYRFGQHLGRGGGWDRLNRAIDVQQAALHVLREWALSPDQTEASLLAALGRSGKGQPHPIAQLIRAEGSFAVDPFEILRSEYADSLAMHSLHWRETPSPARWACWEKSREERLLKVLAIEADADLRRGLTHRTWWNPGKNPRQLNVPYDRLLQNAEVDHRDSSESSPSRGEHWQQSTWGVALSSNWSQRRMSNDFLPTLASLETHRRGLWLTLALQAHRLKHGRLPDRLDELVGPYLDRLPCDPVSGLAFEYRPLGFPFGVASDSRVLAPNTPFVSVPGSQAARREPVTEDYARRNGILSNETSSVNGVNWVSVLANPRLHSPVISEWPQHFSETFSLTPSF